MMPRRTVEPTARHRAFRDDLIAVLRKHGNEVSAEEMLALSAHLVGQILSMQDQRAMTADRGLEIIRINIEAGNKEAIDYLSASKGSA
jgi:hypothetical protein